jgi:hypothetical protein
MPYFRYKGGAADSVVRASAIALNSIEKRPNSSSLGEVSTKAATAPWTCGHWSCAGVTMNAALTCRLGADALHQGLAKFYAVQHRCIDPDL